GNLANAGHTHLERSGVAHSPGDGGPAAGSWWTGRTRCGKGIRLHGRRRIAFRDRIRHVPDAASRQLCAGKSLIATGKNRGRSAFSPGWAGSRASRPGKGTLTPVFVPVRSRWRLAGGEQKTGVRVRFPVRWGGGVPAAPAKIALWPRFSGYIGALSPFQPRWRMSRCRL